MSSSHPFLDYWPDRRSSEDTLLGSDECEEKSCPAGGTSQQPTGRKRYIFCIAFFVASVVALLGAICVLASFPLWHQISHPGKGNGTHLSGNSSTSDNLPQSSSVLHHQGVLISKDVVITLKTGASVIHQRLPAHLRNELAPDSPLPRTNQLIIYSDHEGSFMGHHVVDALANVSRIVRKQRGFQPYFEQKKLLEAGQSASGLKGAWTLDRYKFLPLLRHAYTAYPGAKWFINLEADTYLFYPNLMRLLDSLSSAGQVMLGNPKPAVGGIWFPHGGSGYVISSGLMQDTYGRHKDFERREEQAIAKWCCGDAVLAIAMFKDKHIRIKAPDEATSSGFNDEPPSLQSFNIKNWCDPIYTFHHVTEDDIIELWKFEQKIWRKLLPGDFIRFVDVYSHFLPTFLQDAYNAKEVVHPNWKALNGDLTISKQKGIPYDRAFCQRVCDERKYCWAWQWDEEGECTITVESIKMGQPSSRHTSGFRMDRIRAFRQAQACDGRAMRD